MKNPNDKEHCLEGAQLMVQMMERMGQTEGRFMLDNMGYAWTIEAKRYTRESVKDE